MKIYQQFAIIYLCDSYVTNFIYFLAANVEIPVVAPLYFFNNAFVILFFIYGKKNIYIYEKKERNY